MRLLLVKHPKTIKVVGSIDVVSGKAVISAKAGIPFLRAALAEIDANTAQASIGLPPARQ